MIAFSTQHPALATRHSQRGTALVIVIAALMVLMLVVAGVVSLSARQAQLQMYRQSSTNLDNAVTAAAEMGIREMFTGNDEDGDGVVGSISNNNNPADDPNVNACPVTVTRSTVGVTTTLTATAVNSTGARKEQVVIKQVWPARTTAFFRHHDDHDVNYSYRDPVTYDWSVPAVSGSTHDKPAWVVAKGTRIQNGATVVGVLDFSNDLSIGLADPTAGTASYLDVCTDLQNHDTRAFDIACEDQSGRAVVVYWDNTGPQHKLRYMTYDGALSAPTSCSLVTNAVQWVTCYTHPDSNEIFMVTLNDAKNLNASFWNGSTWSAFTNLSTKQDDTDPHYECYSASYADLSDDLLVVHGNNTNRIYYHKYHAGAWSPRTIIADVGSKVRWVRTTPRKGSNEIFCAFMTDNQKMYLTRWSGAAWDPVTALAGNTGAKDRRMFDVCCSPDGSTVAAVYDRNASTFYYRLWSGGAWGAEQAGPSTGGKIWIVQLRPGPLPSDITGCVSNDKNDLWAFRWDGSASAFNNVMMLSTDIGSDDKFERFCIDPGYSILRIQSWTQVAP